MKRSKLQREYENVYLMYELAFDLFFIVTEIPDIPYFRVTLADKCLEDIRKYGYEKTLCKVLGKL